MADKEEPARKPAAAGGGFVARLVTDPARPPEVAALTGYPGASSIEGHTRLYLSLDLAEYLDIPEDAVLYRQDVPAARDPFGAAYLWIQRDAELIRKGRGQAVSKARFLSGDIQGSFLGGALQAGLLGPTGVQYCTAAPQYCGNTAWPGCPTGGR